MPKPAFYCNTQVTYRGRRNPKNAVVCKDIYTIKIVVYGYDETHKLMLHYKLQVTNTISI